jgi:3'-phosphoadenosine 5'-phosphosulfate sulfotransferase (PAPS reductase)/FAD synthetase
LTAVIGPVEIISAPKTLAEYAVHKGMFPSRLRRWCTDLLKVQPFARYIRGVIDTGHDPLIVVGIRYEEGTGKGDKSDRSTFPEWEEQEAYDAECWRPILRWSYQDVIDIHQRHGLVPNPLYLKGARRVGCWPCIYAGKDEIRLVADVDPGRIDEIRALEASVTVAAESIVRKRGEELTQPRTFFAARSPDGAWPIDRVVTWSRTLRGGKVEDKRMSLLDAAGINDGCMRWGLCETAGEE